MDNYFIKVLVFYILSIIALVFFIVYFFKPTTNEVKEEPLTYTTIECIVIDINTEGFEVGNLVTVGYEGKLIMVTNDMLDSIDLDDMLIIGKIIK